MKGEPERGLRRFAIGLLASLTFAVVASAEERTSGPTPPAGPEGPETPPAAAGAAGPADDVDDEARATLRAGEDGFSVRSADGAFELRLRGYLQVDGRYFFDDDELPIADTWVVRRARPSIEGTLFRIFEFRILPDFGMGETELYDAYLEARFSRAARLRVGKFKPPLGLERLQSATHLLFVERSAPALLVPNRDVGVQLGGELAGSRLEYQVGLFDGVVDGGRGDFSGTGDRDFAARLFWRPFAGSAGRVDLGIGVAASDGRQEGAPAAPQLPSFKTFGNQTFFRYRTDGTEAGTAVADGTRRRIAPQGYLYAGPFGALAEYARSEQWVRRGEERRRLANEAWMLELSWVLSGERNGPRGVAPAHPFDGRPGGRGAWILALRATEIELDPDAFPTFADPARSAARAAGLGACLSWNLTRGVRWMLDAEALRFEGGAAAGGDRPTEKSLMTRFQVAF